MGVSAAQYYLNHNTLTPRQLEFWRAPLRSGEPHICLHADELLDIANAKLARRKTLIADKHELVQDILDKRDELLDLARGLTKSNEPSIFRNSVKELRAWEHRHQIAPAALPVSHEIEQDIWDELMTTMKV
jgi:hypothetical protein